MTYVVTENCIRCKYMDCVEVCPVDCFYVGENMLVIAPDECIDCGVCEPECPAEAIVPDSDDNAAVWAAVTEVAGGPVASAALTHHGPLENGHTVTLLTGPGRMCLMTDDEVRASAEWSLL